MAAAAGVLVIIAGAWLLRFDVLSLRSAEHSAPGTRVVVLPFANLTGDDSASYLADGLTDELIAQLGTIGGKKLAVIARTSAMTYRNTRKTITEIGSELRVQYVLEGSVRREGGALRISSSLVPVVDQTPLARWDESFASTSVNADTQSTRAAIQLARLVAIRLLQPADIAGAPRTTANADAWDALLRASAAIERATAADARTALAYLEQAVSRDPAFAAAWALLAQTKHLLVMMGAERPMEAYGRAKIAAETAVRLDAALAAAHVARGLVSLWHEWQPSEAAHSFERALALNASDAVAHHDYAWALVALGRTADAVRHITTARDLNPLSTRANNDVGWLHLQLRQPVEAARACEHTLAIDTASLEAQACLERAYVQRQLFDAALVAARATIPADGTSAETTLQPNAADALQQLWRSRLNQLEQASRRRWISSYTLAVQYAQVRDHAKALDALEAAYAERAAMMVFMPRDPAFDLLRREPRFEALVRKITGTTS